MTCTSKSDGGLLFSLFLIVAYLFVPLLLFFLICYEKAVENLLVIVLKKEMILLTITGTHSRTLDISL